MKKIVTSGNVSGKPWFDLECTVKCRVVRKALRKFNAVKSESSSNELRINYIEERREYKQLLKQKRAVHKENIIKSLEKKVLEYDQIHNEERTAHQFTYVSRMA